MHDGAVGRRRAVRRSAGAALLAALLLAGGCGADRRPDAGGDGAADRHSPADVAFVRAMIPHHRAGIALARRVAERPAARTLAEAIVATQQDEITQMTGWLAAWGEPATPGPPPPTGGPPGPATPPAAATPPGAAAPPGSAPPPGADGPPGSAPPPDGQAPPDGQTPPGGGSARAAGPSRAGAAGNGADPVRALIAHQREAVELARREQADGHNPAARAFAARVVESRTGEVGQLEAYLRAGG